MRKWQQVGCMIAVLAGVGQLRMGFEQDLSEEMEERRILTPSFDLQSRASLSQKGFVASFGSLRPTLAAVSALGSVKHHSRNEWEELEEVFEDVVLLDPYNPYYWDLGAGHMAYNASSSTEGDYTLPPLARERLSKEWVKKGSNFFDRGIAANPESAELRQAKARLWSSPYRETDFPLAISILQQLLEDIPLSKAEERRVKRDLFHALLRTPDQHAEAYRVGRDLFKNWPRSRFTSLVNGLAALQLQPDLKIESPLPLSALYGTRENALKILPHYLREGSEGKPMIGVRGLLARLQKADDDVKAQ